MNHSRHPPVVAQRPGAVEPRRGGARAQASSRSRRVPALAWLLGCALVATGAAAVAAPALSPVALPRLPGPAPRPVAIDGDPREQNLACEGCHRAIAAEWQSSLHREAWDDPVFQTAHAIEPQPFCRGCHAPEADPASMPGPGARRIGVGCVTCHVQGSEIVGVRGRTAKPGAHAVRADARLATPNACAACHEFAFPDPQPAAMQGTLSEHRGSRFAARPCAACHMPDVPGELGRSHKSHAFRVLGHSAQLRSAVVASARRKGDRTIEVTLAAGAVGHAVPTGDMFRRLEVRARVVGDAKRAAPTVTLARRFVVTRTVDGGTKRTQVGDDRLSPDGTPRKIELSFDVPVAGAPVQWEVAYRRMSPEMSATFGVDPDADETIVAEGVLAPHDAARRPPPR